MDIGFYLINADHSDKTTSIIETINDMVNEHPYDNIILFNNQYNRIDTNKKFPIIHLNQAKYFKGILVVFDIKSAMITKNFPANKKQFLYVDEIYWNTSEPIPFLFWKSILDNDNIDSIAKTEKISDLLEICWKAPVAKMQTINSRELYDIISKV